MQVVVVVMWVTNHDAAPGACFRGSMSKLATCQLHASSRPLFYEAVGHPRVRESHQIPRLFLV